MTARQRALGHRAHLGFRAASTGFVATPGSRAQASWERQCWHLGKRHFACEADTRAAVERELKGKPTWVEIQSEVVAHAHHARKGRPHKEVIPTTYQWQIVATVTLNKPLVGEEALSSPETDSTPDDAALVFHCFEGIELLLVQTATTSLTVVLPLESVHRLILALLGTLYEKIYIPSGSNCGMWV